MEERKDIYGDDYSNEIFFLYFDFENEIRRVAALNEKVPWWIKPMIDHDLEEIYQKKREIDEKEDCKVDIWMEEYRLARIESIPKDKIDKIRLLNDLNEEETKIELANQDFLIEFLERMGLAYIKNHFDIFIEKVLSETFRRDPTLLRNTNYLEPENLDQEMEIRISKEIQKILRSGKKWIIER